MAVPSPAQDHPRPSDPSLRSRWATLSELRELWPYFRAQRYRFCSGLLFGVIAACIMLTLPYLIGVIVDAAVPGSGRRPVPGLTLDADTAGWIVMVALLVQAGCIYLHFFWVATASQRAVAALRGAVFERLVQQRMLFFAQQRVGELTTRMTGDLAEFGTLLAHTLPLLLRQSLMFTGSGVLLVSASPRLALLMFAILPPLGVAVGFMSRRIRRLQREVHQGLALVGAVATEALSGIATVKAFHQEHREVARHASSQNQYLRSVFRVVSVQAALVALVVLALSVTIAAVIWHGVNLVRAGELTSGELARFVVYTAFLAGGIALVAEHIGAVQRALGATQRLRELLREDVEPIATESGTDPARIRGDVEFREVNFAYPTRPGVPVLNGLSLRIAAGECLALVGPSGVGKTTVASLLLRFYEPDSGQVLVDGRDLKAISLSALRNQVALVPQEVVLFSGTIAENIAYGRSEASHDEIMEAARQAHAHEFIAALPEGYATVVGERGVQLSGGQRQRIAIARCILRNPSILILDEATSALDAESERLLQEAMRAVVAGRTTLIIAHRLSTVRMADRIAALDRGAVVELGTHEELMLREEGVYRNLSALQLAAGEST